MLQPDIVTDDPADGTPGLPPVAPHGGSKWRHVFGRQRPVRVGRGEIVLIEGGIVAPDGGVSLAGPDAECREETVFVLPAGAGVCLGRFLVDRLPGFRPREGETKAAKLCGGRLSRRQTDILARLGLLRDYIVLEAPTAFQRVLSFAGQAEMAPATYIRKLADRLRGSAAAGVESARVAILPRREDEKFSLANRASLVAWLRAKQFVSLDPEEVALDETIRVLACASLVLLADPGQAGLLGLCSPGCRVLEVAPEGWLTAEAHWLSLVFGLAWAPFLAAPPSYPLLGTLPFGATVPMSYEISIRDLAVALESFASS